MTYLPYSVSKRNILKQNILEKCVSRSVGRAQLFVYLGEAKTALRQNFFGRTKARKKESLLTFFSNRDVPTEYLSSRHPPMKPTLYLFVSIVVFGALLATPSCMLQLKIFVFFWR
jgi:hypothetical protein